MSDPLAGRSPRKSIVDNAESYRLSDNTESDHRLMFYVGRATETEPAFVGIKYEVDGDQYGHVWDNPNWLDAMGITVKGGNHPLEKSE